MTVWKSLVILGLFILILIVVFVFWANKEKQMEPGEISWQEKEQIDIWLVENDLNQYGDPKGTMYTGGTPLFDERTGQGIDKYEYILMNHSDRPWKR